jgi:hypothetical protein
MNRKAFQAFIWLMWLALPFTAFRFWVEWGRLPLRMATHFDVNWQPNGWMLRDTAFYFALGITAFVLAVFTIVSYFAHKTHAPEAFSWALLGFFYLITGFVYSVNSGVVEYNVNGQRIGIDPWAVLIPVAILVLVSIFLGAKRGDSLPPAVLIVEETHGSRIWSLLFIAVVLAQCVAAVAIPATPFRIASIVFVLLFAVIAVHIWTGFQYVFTSAGLEIRTLGFRLQSIPREEIQSNRGICFAVMGSAAWATVGLMFGATAESASRRPMAKFFWDTKSPSALFTTWIQSRSITPEDENSTRSSH